MSSTTVGADLTFELDGPEGVSVHGRLHGQDNRLVLDVDHPEVFAGRGDAATVRGAAELLAARGVRVRVVHAGVHLITLGAVSAPWWQRRATGTRHIRLGSWRGTWTSLRARSGDRSAVLPGPEALPPTTLLPLLPTFARRPRRRATTTHDHHGGGAPRLVLEKQVVWPGERQPVFWLEESETVIGSEATCGVCLPGLRARHAVVRHTDEDEYVLASGGPEVRVHGALVGGVSGETVLRTGARIDVGGHQLSFYREEYADHGRPFGGRVGGEAGHQRPHPRTGAGRRPPGGAPVEGR